MQTSLTFATDNRLPEILARGRQLLPQRAPRVTDPLGMLLFAMVSDGAAPAVGLAVYNRLKAEFPRWSDLRDASPEAVAGVLVGVPGAAKKAEGIPAMLAAIEAERGVIELDFLRRLGSDAATRWLERLPGVNAEIAAAVLSFSDLRRPVMSIGREAGRCVRRLGLAPASAPLSALPRHVAELAPAGWAPEEFADLARGLAKLARTTCTEGRPACGACPMSDLCPSAGRRTATVVAFPGRAAAAPAQNRPVRTARR